VNEFVIRNALASEKALLEDLQLRASLTNEGDREALLAHPDAIDLPMEQIAAQDVFVLEIGGLVAGFAALLPRLDGDTELDGLFVDPDLRRRGAGRMLVEYSAQIARDRGSKALWVIGNPHAEEFYFSCGFSAIGQFETRFGPALQMRKPLLPA
jgi:GNAT superfamily N-acetyltransferase